MAQAKFDIRTEVTRPLFAYVGVTDRAVEAVRESVTDLQKRFVEVQKDVQTRVQSVSKSVQDLDLEPKALRAQATTVVNGRVEALSKDAQARRAAIEARVAELQERLRNLLKQNEVTYDQLVVRGETLVERIRRQQSTQDAVSSAKTSSAKAKTTRTQATKATKSTAKTAERAAKSTAKTAERAAKSTTATARKSSTAPQSSAKATGTTAKRTAKSAGKATAQAAKKVGD
jgi:Mg-chelatase subunit ChlI